MALLDVNFSSNTLPRNAHKVIDEKVSTCHDDDCIIYRRSHLKVHFSNDLIDPTNLVSSKKTTEGLHPILQPPKSAGCSQSRPLMSSQLLRDMRAPNKMKNSKSRRYQRRNSIYLPSSTMARMNYNQKESANLISTTMFCKKSTLQSKNTCPNGTLNRATNS